MAYTILEHTADLRIKVTGKKLEQLFNDAATGMFDFLKGKKKQTIKNTGRENNKNQSKR